MTEALLNRYKKVSTMTRMNNWNLFQMGQIVSNTILLVFEEGSYDY